MNFEISEKKLKELEESFQRILDSELNLIREESKEWGLGEMHEIEQIESVKKIEIDRIVPYLKIKLYIKIYSTHEDEDYDYSDLRAELQYRIEEWFPNIELYIDEVIN